MSTPLDDDFGPQVHYSAEAEKAVLGAILAQPDVVLGEVLEAIGPDDLFVPANRVILTEIIAIDAAGRPIDMLSVHRWLTDRKLAESVASPGVLAEMMGTLCLYLSNYLRIIREKSVLRRLQAAAVAIVEDVAENPDDVGGVIDRAEAAISTIALRPGEVKRESTVQVVDRTAERINTPRKGLVGLPTGFSQLDEMTQGWKPGEMIVLAARPGQGKTALALGFALAVCEQRWDEAAETFVAPGHSVGIIELEMPADQLIERAFAQLARVPFSMIRRGVGDDDNQNAILIARDRLRSWPLHIEALPSLTIAQLRSRARRLVREKGIEMLIVDYLQLMESPTKQGRENRANEVAEISRGIKGIAMELKIPVIALAQLNRQSEGRSERPRLHNIRESGAIEQDADVVMLLHRKERDEDQGSSPIVECELDVAKQRNGPCDVIRLLFHGPFLRFDEPVRRI